jgi:hypothetical protein
MAEPRMLQIGNRVLADDGQQDLLEEAGRADGELQDEVDEADRHQAPDVLVRDVDVDRVLDQQRGGKPHHGRANQQNRRDYRPAEVLAEERPDPGQEFVALAPGLSLFFFDVYVFG